jgi:hypothetical protein
MYGRVFAAVRAAGQSSRARLADLFIASTAAANGLPLYTRNPNDFAVLKRILKVVKVLGATLFAPSGSGAGIQLVEYGAGGTPADNE